MAISSFAGVSLEKPIIMGIVNVTPDSFSDGGIYFDHKKAVEHGQKLWHAGARIIDIGGESTRPGSLSVPPEEQIRRIIPVVKELANCGIRISVDTTHSQVMEVALECGAQIINDISALSFDPKSFLIIQKYQASVILMHMRGNPLTMQQNPFYENVCNDVFFYLEERINFCREHNIELEKIAIDPGIGFGKTTNHDLSLIAHLDIFTKLKVPIVIGVSRKKFIGFLSNNVPPDQRLAGSLIANLKAWIRGAHIFRVHDVQETIQAFSLWNSLSNAL
ncbi:MAG: dihydropteroate synthase [Alphaproteobacteria bacterium]|nr:dihydropteroate synthase [Alphaproteobacteria bacterium]